MRTPPFVLLDRISVLFAQAYHLARSRLLSHSSPILRLTGLRDHTAYDLALTQRECNILRTQRQAMNPRKRPDFHPGQRAEILLIRRLRGWSIQQTAERFVLHPNTVRIWIHAAEGRIHRSNLFRTPSWNRIHDALRWTVHEIRRLCPHPELGSRAIAAQLVRAGVRISRSSVQRILREQTPKKPTRPSDPTAPSGRISDKLLRPRRANHVWHLDLTSLGLPWMRLSVAAILDGFSRKLLAIKLYRGAPNARQMVRLVRSTISKNGQPKHIITDHGTQFRGAFRRRIEKTGIRHVQGRVRCPATNAKVERFFRTFKQWWRIALLPLSLRSLQRRLDRFGCWYNQLRSHQALGRRTPEEAWNKKFLPKPVALRAADPTIPLISIRRKFYRGDPSLPMVNIVVKRLTPAA